MVNGCTVSLKHHCFVTPPLTPASSEWLLLDSRLPADHLAREVDIAVTMLDLSPLWESYLCVGRKALPPDLLLKAVIYEMHSKRPSPAQWRKDSHEHEPLRWLLCGLEPSRACWYDFRDRLAPFWDEWNAQILHQAVAVGMAAAQRVAVDSTSVAANASRRKLLNEERLQKRQQVINEHLRAVQSGEPIADEPPGWLATTESGLHEQKRRYAHAAEIMEERQAANAQRLSGKRKPPDKVLVSPADPEAILARDKDEVFRPLYSAQLVRDLDSPLILAHSVLTQNNDNGVLPPLVERLMDNVGVKPKEVLVDSGYVSMQHLEFCQSAGITLYGPCQENDFTVANDKKPQSNQFTTLPKSAFTWLKEEQTYRCPEGHVLEFATTTTRQRTGHTIALTLYTCSPEHCRACPRQRECTSAPQKGRSVSRMENEELLDELRQRMRTEEAKELYKLRCRTVEQSFADLKEHRGLRRFHGRGLVRVRAEVDSLVLTHNLLQVVKYCPTQQNAPSSAELSQALNPA